MNILVGRFCAVRCFLRVLMRFSLLLGLGFIQLAQGQVYQPSGKSYELTWPRGKWNGKESFRDVYCVTFPAAEQAQKVVYSMFNGNAIYLVRVLYPDNLLASIAVSTIPAGRGQDEEINRLLDLERQAEAGYEQSYNITEFSTDFGRSIALRIKDVAPKGPAVLSLWLGPFIVQQSSPLNRFRSIDSSFADPTDSRWLFYKQRPNRQLIALKLN